MRFGVCTGIDMAQQAQEAGFDYIECNASALAQMTDREFQAAKAKMDGIDIKCECWNILFNHTMTLLGKNATDWKDIQKHLVLAFNRIRQLGGSIVVFGSGKCRSFEQGEQSFYQAYAELAQLTAKIGKVAEDFGITLVIEPLNSKETNMICTLAEGAMLVAQLNSANIKLLADGYHMFMDEENLTNLSRVGEIHHAHIATKGDRKFPIAKDQLLEGFFAELKKIGYTKRLSIEGSTEDFKNDAALALEIFRSCQ